MTNKTAQKIRFTSQMAKAIRSGIKTQTRRVCRFKMLDGCGQNSVYPFFGDGGFVLYKLKKESDNYLIKTAKSSEKTTPRYDIGALLQVFETVRGSPDTPTELFLSVRQRRVERLCEITEADAKIL
jgi:hypothetical protein